MTGSRALIIHHDLALAVSKVAPLLGRALSSKAARIALPLVGQALGIPFTDTSALLAALGNPVNAPLLAATEQDYQLELQAIIADDQDHANARMREMTLKDHIPAILAISFLVIYVVIELSILWVPYAKDDIISARVQDIVIMIVSYYFGSTHKPVVSQGSPNT